MTDHEHQTEHETIRSQHGAGDITSFLEALRSAWLPDSWTSDPDNVEFFNIEDPARYQAMLRKAANVLGLHPRLMKVLASGWSPLQGPGQVQPGDYLSLTLSGKPICVKAQQVLCAGTDREEVIYNRKRNHYFITAMALEGSSTHKAVYVRSGAAGGAK